METTITLSQSTTGRVDLTVGVELLTSTKDGGQLVTRVDRILRENRIKRGTGYSYAEGGLVATGGDFR